MGPSISFQRSSLACVIRPSNEAHWNAAAPQGIMNNINGTGHNLLEKYHLRPPSRSTLCERFQTNSGPRKAWWKLLGLLLFASQTVTVHAIPGTPHAIVSEASLDTSRQASLTETVVNNLTSASASDAPDTPDVDAHSANSVPPETSSESNPSPIPTEPYCFVVDTDSQEFLIDSGANAVIVNKAKLLTDFKPTSGGVNGIGGTPVDLNGTGFCTVPLHFDDGSSYTVQMPAVYVPSSPYNIVPPQLLIKHLKEQGCGADSQLNNELFQLRFSSPSNWRGERDLLRDSDATDCVMSVPLDRRNLFTMWTNPGYQSFFSQASQFNPEYAYFAGASH
eukprot:scaffold6984_cov81-Cylindrotheca_fusiformis.AAC.1